VLSGVITYEDYRHFQTQYYQPDSPEKQRLRRTTMKNTMKNTH